MACSVAPALPLEMFHRVGAGCFAMVSSKPRHRRTGAVVFAGTDDEVAEVLHLHPAAVPDSEVVPHDETRDLAAGGFARVVSKAGKARHRRAGEVFAGTDDEVAEVLRRPAEDEDEAAAATKMAKRRWGGETKETIVAAPWLPTGVLGEPPESLARSGPDMTAAFLASLIAAGDAASSDTPPGDCEVLAARWTERKEACLHRARYLRDYCPFQREEESEPETTTMAPLPEKAEEAEAPVKVKTGLALDSAESEAEFVTAIRSRYLLKDGFVSRCAAQEPPVRGPAVLCGV